MPDKDKANGTKKTEEQAVEGDARTVDVVKARPPWPLITIGVVATVVIVAVVIAGWMFIATRHNQPAMSRNGLFGQMRQANGQYYSRAGGGFRRGGGMLQSAQARGVVTAVNGDTITVSGQGKSTTVKKSSSTMISGDKTDVAVNDTVVVFGTTQSDGSVDATRILVRNTDPTSGATMDGSSTPGA